MPLLEKWRSYLAILRSLDQRMHRVQQSLARIECRQLSIERPYDLNEYEFQVYSQWGEDGLIQHLVRNLVIDRTTFVEFGVENYTEANTRFLLINNNWSGVVFDASEKNVLQIRNDPIYWKHNLKAECAFIDRENVNELIAKNGMRGDIGLLSIDIDGNDYWIWEAITVISPRIVVCEYNSLWGFREPVTIPYDSSFDRTRAHYSNLYYGASIGALESLGRSKGYSLVSSNRAGNNLFFVRNDVLGSIRPRTAADVWVQAQFRESRSRIGQLTELSFDERIEEIADMALINITDQKRCRVRDLISLAA